MKKPLLFIVTVLVGLSAWAQNVISTVTTNENEGRNSTVYVGEVVVDGTSVIKYLYSGDISLYSVVRQNLLDALSGMADSDFAALLGGHEFDDSQTQGFSLCANADLIASMDENWSSALYVGNLYYPGKTVTSEVNSNMYDIDEGFKAVLDTQTEERVSTINNPVDAEKCIVSHLDVSSTDNVYYTVEGGQVIKHVDTNVVYSCEVTTVIYTKVELETPGAPSALDTPFTFEAVEDGAITVNQDEDAPFSPIQYKLNDAEWADVDWGEPIALTAGDAISFRGDNGTCYATDEETYWAGFHFEPTADCYVYGNMMSLIDKDGFATNTTLTETYTFFHLFQRSDYEPNTAILNHPSKDILLPATTLTPYCYDGLFADAPNITRAPELPATTLAEWCYSEMFSGTAITAAPALPATTLTESCYADMFMNCVNLTAAPELPAATLAEGCYTDMFAGCTTLNYVKCLATDISADYCLIDWLWGVAETGTFVKAADMEGWTLDSSDGIPEGWTVLSAYKITLPEATEHGTVGIDKENAVEGETVTLTVKPDEGYVLGSLTVTIDGTASAAPQRLGLRGGSVPLYPGDELDTYTFEMPAAAVTVNATFKASTVLGDLNGDGLIDGSDVSAMLEIVLEGGDITPAQLAAGDFDGSGTIDGSDVSALLEVVLSGE